MLQPLQLRDVSARYGSEIAELRSFLLKADCVPEVAESLSAVVTRLQRDRAFHRDLTSYIWTVVHSCNRGISYADLLGVLAIAAAGTHFAAEAHEDDAHNLLRFVMEAKQGFDGASDQKLAISPTISPNVVPVQVVETQGIREQVLLPRERSLSAESPSIDVDGAMASRKHVIWIAACALVSLSIVLVLHYHTTPKEDRSQLPAAVTTGLPSPVVSKEDISPGLRSEAEPTVSPRSVHRNRSAVAPPMAQSLHKPFVKDSSPLPESPTPPPRIETSTVARVPAVSSPTSSALVSPVAPPETATTAKRLGSSSSQDASSQAPSNIVREHQTPHLLRRTPEERADLVAELLSPDVAGPKINSNASSNAFHGTVQAVSLGTNAANVLYSPTPAYPSAAAAAHVQGEVKLEANVDSKGNVASVRVISGPPLLREAALDAAQRWRYRPNMAAGERISMNAITVFEFQLP